MTGCTYDSTGYFGTAGRYVLKLGEDMFGTGKQGIVGGDLPTEPQGNEEGLIFYNYDVKEVDKDPKDEKQVNICPHHLGLLPASLHLL